MNKQGQIKGTFLFVLILLGFIFMIGAFTTVDPLKEALDDVRDTTSLNCPGTSSFNQTDYDDDSTLERLTRRPTCFATGLLLPYFIGAFLIAVVIWIFKKWGAISR